MLNPNFSDWRFAGALDYSGEFRGLKQCKLLVASRLDPFYAPFALAWFGLAQYMLKRYAEAVAPLRECVSRAPLFRGGHERLAATYAQLGRLEEARAEASELLRINPNYTIDGTARQLFAFKHERDEEHFVEGLRKAGLPE